MVMRRNRFYCAAGAAEETDRGRCMSLYICVDMTCSETVSITRHVVISFVVPSIWTAFLPRPVA